MRLLAATVVLGIVTLSACGAADSTSSSASTATPSPSPSAGSSCPNSGAVVGQAVPLAKVDLAGDGTREAISVYRVHGCPDQLGEGMVVGKDQTWKPVEVPDPGTPITAAFGVTLTGHHGQLLVTQQNHPRGGYQLHVYALADKKLVELQDRGNPLVPFVATDTRPISYAVNCEGGSIVVSQAVAKTNGRWDLRRTTFTVAGGTATKSDSGLVAGNLSARQADQLLPAGAAVFPSCGGKGGRGIG
jgi:hypothetical protein